MAPRVPMMRMKEYKPIFSCLLRELFTSRPQQASATALMPFAPLILEAAQGGVPARLLSLKHQDSLAPSQQDEDQAAQLSQLQAMGGAPGMRMYYVGFSACKEAYADLQVLQD